MLKWKEYLPTKDYPIIITTNYGMNDIPIQKREISFNPYGIG